MNEFIKFPASIMFLFRKSNFMYGFILGFRHVPIKLAPVQAVYRGSVLDMYFAVQLNIDLCLSVSPKDKSE
jgi:hypothetical protein